MRHKQARCHRPEAIQYDNSNITETTVYTHLGVTQSSHGKQPYNVNQVKQGIRGTYLALATLVAGQDGAIPLTLCKLYSLSVLPKALFGCELWHNISRSDMRQLEIAHHFCLKHSQGFQRDTRSDIVKGMLGITSIEAYIDKQKLAFFGSVFRTPPTDLVNQLITYRLFHYSMRITEKHVFIFSEQIFLLLNKYFI